MILAITFLEFLGLYFMGMDVFWWCDQNYYGFFGALFRVIPGVLVVMTQIGSIKLYENVISERKGCRASLSNLRSMACWASCRYLS